MSVARAAVGSWTTSACPPRAAAGSSGVMRAPLEEVAAEQVVGVRPLHIRSRVHDHVPVAAWGRVLLGDRRPGGGGALSVGDDRGERGGDASALLTAADVDVRHVPGR